MKYLSVFLGNSGEPRLGESSCVLLEDDEVFEEGDALLVINWVVEFGELLELKVTLLEVGDNPLTGLVDVLFGLVEMVDVLLEVGDVLFEITGLLEAPEALEALKRLISSGEVFGVVEVVERLEMLDVLLEGRDDLLSTESLKERGAVPSKDTCLPTRPKEGGG